MSNIYKKAHAMAKQICEEYNDVDYKTQFQLCLSYLSNDNINKRIKEISSEAKVSEDEARLLENVEFYYKNIFNTDENLKFRLWKRQEKKRVYLSSSYINNKPYVDLTNNKLYDNNKTRNL